MAQTISLIVIDDEELIAEALGMLCQRIPRVPMVGLATSGEDGLALLERTRPRIALVDLAMPRMSGVDVISHARKKRILTRCIVLTGTSDHGWCAKAMRAGAAGYMLKGGAVDELHLAIHTVAKGKNYVTPDCAGVMERDQVHGSNGQKLPARHHQVLKLIVDGHANKQIAGQLDISIKTVEKHRTELMRRLRVHSTAELVKHAIVRRLVVPLPN